MKNKLCEIKEIKRDMMAAFIIRANKGQNNPSLSQKTRNEKESFESAAKYI